MTTSGYGSRLRPGADLDLSTASADVDGRGDFGAAKVNTASGDIRFEHVGGEAQVNSASGDVNLDQVDGALTVNTASGDVEIRRIQGEGKVRAASGDISIDEADSSLKVQTASGDVEVDSVREGEVTLQTASGDIEVGIKQGSKLWIDARSMSGETSSELELGDAPSRRRRPAGRGAGDCHERRHHGQARLGRCRSPSGSNQPGRGRRPHSL